MVIDEYMAIYSIMISHYHACIGSPNHPDYEITKTQCTGFGGMVSFLIKGNLENGRKFMKSLKV